MTSQNDQQAQLFPAAVGTPPGFSYCSAIISPEEQSELVQAMERLTFSEIKMHGVVAKRRTIHFGRSYDFQTFQLGAAAAIPAFLLPLRERAAEFSNLPGAEFQEALITEYEPGAAIGWHRDAPQFGTVVGISLVSDCTMQFRPWPPTKRGPAGSMRKTRPVAQILAARSAYILAGSARQNWQHRIAPIKTLRYSVTFRTLRAGVP